MTEWTSISLTQSQKDVLLQDKPDDLSMGEFLVALAEDGDVSRGGVDPDALEVLLEQAVADADVTVERSEAQKDAEILASTVMSRLEGLDEDVRVAAEAGAKAALEEVAR